jgi:SulP family sulfate permease
MPVAPKGLMPHLRRWAAHLPGTIVVLVLATLAVVLLELPVETIGSRFGGIPQALPAFALPEFSWATAKLLVIPTITIALLGAIESLLCARVADNMAPQHRRHDPNQELMAQGIANLVTPFFGGIPATGTIARTVTNVRAGAGTPIAGIVHAATLLAIVLRLRHFLLPYRATLLGTFVLTVVFDLTVAVEVGLLMACGFFIYRMSALFSVKPHPTHSADGDLPPGVAVFELFGSLFFGAVGKIEGLSEQLPPGTRCLVLEMHRLISIDTSGIDALEQLHRTLARQGIGLVLAHVNPQPMGLIRRSGFEAELGAENIVETVEAALKVPGTA